MTSIVVRCRFPASTILLTLTMALSTSFARTAAQRATSSPTNQIVLTLDPGRSVLRWHLNSTLHTVHGTFVLIRGIVKLDPATDILNGEIVADATSGKSGNGSRDKRMNKEILESQRYTELVFRPDAVVGSISTQGASMVQVHGTFLLHGAEHQLTVPVQVELGPNDWKGTARFTIPYVQWGVKNPSNFLLKVDASVDIEMEMTGSLQRSAQL